METKRGSEAYVDHMLGIEHEPPTEERRRKVQAERWRVQKAQWRLGPVPRAKGKGGAEKALDAALGIDAQEGLIHAVGEGPEKQCCKHD